MQNEQEQATLESMAEGHLLAFSFSQSWLYKPRFILSEYSIPAHRGLQMPSRYHLICITQPVVHRLWVGCKAQKVPQVHE